MPLLVLLLAVVLAEIAAFVWVASQIGLLATLVWVVGAIIAGVLLMRSMGTNIATTLQSALASGRNPGMDVAENALLALAAILLILPGILSDLVALALLPRPIRRIIIARIAARANMVVRSKTGESDIFDGEFEVVESEQLTKHQPGRLE